MAERTDELREDIARRRGRISRDVDEIGNRVRPGRVLARSTYRVRRRVIDLRDDVMGNEQTEYPWQETDRGAGGTMTQTRERMSDRMSEMADTAAEKMHEAEETITEVPQMVRRQTRGNPLAAGLIAFGGGLLIASIFGPTEAERSAARRAQPLVQDAMDEVKETGEEMAAEMKDSAMRSADDIKDEARQAGERLRDEASDAARTTSEQASH